MEMALISQAEMLVKRGIMATAVQNKERSAERELMEYLEEVSASYHVAQLLTPDLRCTVSRDNRGWGSWE